MHSTIIRCIPWSGIGLKNQIVNNLTTSEFGKKSLISASDLSRKECPGV